MLKSFYFVLFSVLVVLFFVTDITPASAQDITISNLEQFTSSKCLVLTLNTNISSKIGVEFGTDPEDLRRLGYSSPDSTDHVFRICMIVPGTTVYYRFYDSSGSGEISILTPLYNIEIPSNAQLTTVTPFSIKSSATGLNSAVIRWTTNRKTRGVLYDTKIADPVNNTIIAEESSYTTEHYIFLDNLSTNPYRYNFNISGYGENGEYQGYQRVFFSMPKELSDYNVDVSVSDITTNSALIRIDSNTVYEARINYGETDRYGEMVDVYGGNSRSYKLTNLKPNTTYHYRIQIGDLLSDSGEIDIDRLFTTKNSTPTPNNNQISYEPVTSNLIKVANDSGVYMIDASGKRRLFVNAQTFWSHYSGSWSNIKHNGSTINVRTVSLSEFDGIEAGENVRVRPGNRLIRFINSPRVYVMFGGNNLKYFTDSEVGNRFGSSWREKLVVMQNAFELDYVKNDSGFIDSDHDGIADDVEEDIYETDPNNSDSDRDGYSDGIEILFNYNPNGVGSMY